MSDWAAGWQYLRDVYAGFAWPWAGLLLPLPWLTRRLLPPLRTAGAALKVPYGSPLQSIAQTLASWRPGRIALLPWLVWGLLCAALARPQTFGEVIRPPHNGRDLMLALDLSGSMSETDMMLGGHVVDRLTVAKAVLADFLQRREGDRVGLLVFGQRAYALSPLTLDRQSVRAQLADSSVGLAGRETALGDAIGLAVKRLQAQKEGQRVLILLTDGVNTAGVLEPLKAAELAAQAHVRVHTIALGGGGEVSLFGLNLPLPDAGAEEIDEDTLRRIATQTGGQFFRARDTAQLANIYAELDHLEPVQLPGQQVRPRIERYYWPLLAALCVALSAVLLPRMLRWRRG